MGGLLYLVQREGAWAGCGPAQSAPRCTKCNSPPTNGQCTNFMLFDVALPVCINGLTGEWVRNVMTNRRARKHTTEAAKINNDYCCCVKILTLYVRLQGYCLYKKS